MKTVFDPSTVAHLWANSQQDNARNSGSTFYFEKDTIYSYGHHFPIARHVTNERGEQATLFTTRTYSNTTAKHISITRSAASHKNLIFCYDPTGTHDLNFERYEKEILSIASNLNTARKPEKYISEIGGICHRVNTYSNFFGLTIPVTLRNVMSITNKAELLQYTEKAAEYKKQEDARKLAQQKKDEAQAFKKFRKFEIPRVYGATQDALRVNKESGEVETSQGVKITIPAARALFSVLASVVAGNKPLPENLTINNYTVTSVQKKVVKIGCHNIHWKECANVAKQLNWTI